MKEYRNNNGVIFFAERKFALVCVFALLFSASLFAQNTKGDRPVSAQQQLKESKGQKKSRKGKTSERVQNGSSSRASKSKNSASSAYFGRRSKDLDKPAKPIVPIYNNVSYAATDRAWQGNIRGKKIRNNTEAIRKARKQVNVYPQPVEYKRYLAKRAKKKEKVSIRTASGELPFLISPRESERVKKPQDALGSAVSIPHSFVEKGRRNVYWGKFRKGEKPFLKDLTGRPIRRKNFSSNLQPLVPQRKVKTQKNTAKSYLGDGGIPAGAKRDNAWLGNSSGKKIRLGKFRDIEVVGINNNGIAQETNRKKIIYSTGDPLSISGSRGPGKPLPTRGYVELGSDLSGWTKARRPLKGGGSISGFLWNNNNKSIKERATPGRDNYSGFVAGVYPQPGPGTLGLRFGGNIKAKKPAIGGESISGILWNNDNKSIKERATPTRDEYTGFVLGEYPIPSGGTLGKNSGIYKAEATGQSVSGILWNNDNKSIKERATPTRDEYMGFIYGAYPKPNRGTLGGNVGIYKAKVAGKSVSGVLWNNGNRSIRERATPTRDEYTGFILGEYPKPSRGTSGESFGRYKAKVGGQSISGRLWNNEEKAIASIYAENPRASVATSGKIKQREYIQHPKANIASIKKLRPTPNALAVDGIKSKMKQGNYQRRPKGVESAMPGIGPKESTVKAALFAGKTKLNREYVQHPKTSTLALKVLSQPKSYAKMADFQTNLKMKKPSLKNTHPDAKFAHLKENNVKEERTFLTTVKLTWAKIFKKNKLQPEASKPNEHPLRYDRREKDLWTPLYDYNERKK